MLEVVTPAASLNLVSLEAVKLSLNITGQSENEKIESSIAQASAAIAQECNSVFAQETVRETFRLQRRTLEVFLSRNPVSTITSVTESGVAVESGGFELDRVANSLRRLSGEDMATWWAPAKIVVQYTAGYALADVPADLQRAAITLVRYYRRSADPLLRSITIEGVGERVYQDFQPGGPFPPEVAGLVANHRKPCVG